MNYAGVERLLMIKLFKPYEVGKENHYIYITLAYRYFDMIIENNLYHFIPIASQKIYIDNQTKEVINLEDRFAFQYEHKIIYIEMSELMTVPNFLNKVHEAIDIYLAEDNRRTYRSPRERKQATQLIAKLEGSYIKQLIDQALDDRNEKQFYELTKKLQRHRLKTNSF